MLNQLNRTIDLLSLIRMTRGTIDSRSDYQLVRDHARGEASAFHELIARHQNKLWAVALRTTGNHDDASDALQEALLSRWCRMTPQLRL